MRNTPRRIRCSWASPLPRTLSRTRKPACCCRRAAAPPRRSQPPAGDGPIPREVPATHRSSPKRINHFLSFLKAFPLSPLFTRKRGFKLSSLLSAPREWGLRPARWDGQGEPGALSQPDQRCPSSADRAVAKGQKPDENPWVYVWFLILSAGRGASRVGSAGLCTDTVRSALSSRESTLKTDDGSSGGAMPAAFLPLASLNRGFSM